MKHKKVFSFLLIGLVVSGMTVSAADVSTSVNGNILTKTYTFTTSDTADLQVDQDANIPEQVKENGKKYNLQEFTYEVTSKDPVITEEEVTKVIESDLIPDGEDYVPEKTIREDGVTYTYVSHEPSGDAVVETVTGYYDYDQAVTSADVPATKEFPAEDGTMVSCSFTGASALNTGVWEDTYINITFQSYDADTFEWQGIEVSKSETNPLKGYETELLASVGANTSDYKVGSTYWAGAAYDNNGVLCRDARANVQKYVRYYRANYTGTYNPGTIYKLTYKGTDKVESDDEYVYTVVAKATYKRSIVSTVIMACTGILILVLLIVLILYLLSKKKKEEEEKEKM